jgi:hypothetical protein
MSAQPTRTLGDTEMRKLGITCAALCGVLAVPATAQAATVTQPQSGSANGTFSYSVYTGTRSEQGHYQSNGQLGSGSYEITTTTATMTGCLDSDMPTATARFVRSDGAVLRGNVTGDLDCGAPIGARLTIALTHGSTDLLGTQLAFERTAAADRINPSGGGGVEHFTFSGTTIATKRVGYLMVDATGRVYAFGGLTAGHNAPTTNAAHIEPTPTRNGYWIVDHDGHVFAFGGARWFGNIQPTVFLPGEEATSLSATPSGKGYWVFTNRGRVVQFGDANFFGDLRAVPLRGPIVGSIATPTGDGYYLVGSDGGVFAFGDARFLGSMAGTRLDQPVIGIVPTTNGSGYWLVASDGGVFAFRAPFLGSMGGVALNRPIVGLVRYGSGYLMVGSDGGIFSFSTSPFFGSLGANPPPNPIVAAAASA